MIESPNDPPLLRLGTATQNCGACINFYLLQRRYPSDDGRCSLFKTFIRSDFVCDAFYSIYSANENTGPDITLKEGYVSKENDRGKGTDKDITRNTDDAPDMEQIW